MSPSRASLCVRIRKASGRRRNRLRSTGRSSKLIPNRRKSYPSPKPTASKKELAGRPSLVFAQRVAEQKVVSRSPEVQTQKLSLFELQRESFERFWRIKSSFDFSNIERGIRKQSAFSGETLELSRQLASYNPFISPGDNHLTSAHMSPAMALSPAFEDVEMPARVAEESNLKFQTPQTLRFQLRSFDSDFSIGKKSSEALSRASRKPKLEGLQKLEFPGETKVSIEHP